MDNVAHQPIPTSPYVGLQPYSEAERDYFFGREQDTETIAANLLTAPLTLLYGASGVGKTSVLSAGVVPYLRAMPNVLVVLFRSWQDETFLSGFYDSIAREIKTQTGKPFFYVESPLPIDEFLSRAAQETQRTLLIILDQFEEYFLYHPYADPFEEQFARAVNRGDVNANFLIALREDALSQLDRFETRIPNLMSNGLRLEHLNRDGAERAIRKPLDVYNARRASEPPITIQDSLVNALIDQVRTGRVTLGHAGQGTVGGDLASPQTTDTRDGRIETPFLQMVLTRLWDEETRTGLSSLKLETLYRLGGAEKIVRTHLDAVMNKLTPPEQDVCSSFFDRMVTPSGTKIAQNADDLVTYAARPAAQVTPVLKKLADARVLRPIVPPLNQPQTARYEIYHDVLAPAILDWRKRFVERRRTRRLRMIALGAGLVILVFALLAIFAIGESIHATIAEADALQQRDTASAQANARATAQADALQQRDVAEQARAEALKQKRISDAQRLVAQSSLNRETNLDLALLLGVEALALDNNVEAQGNLLNSLTSKPQLARYLHGHTNYVYSVAFSPDGKTLASGSADKTILLWDMTTHQPIGQPLTGHSNYVYSVAFSPDGKTLASGSIDNTIILWDVSTRQPIGKPLTGHSNSVLSVAFSPDGKTLASGSVDMTIILWDVATRQPIGQPLTGHTSFVNSVAFSPDGKTLASGSYDKTIVLWDVATRQPIGKSLTGHSNSVLSVAFSPDGKTLASGSIDKTIILWTVVTRQSIGQPLTGHSNSVLSVAFSPDGKTLASGSLDKNIILWDVATRQPIVKPLTGHSNYVYSVAFSPDGKMLASGSWDSAIILWDISIALNTSMTTRQLIVQPLTGHSNSVFSVAFSPDGKTLASGSGDKTIILWDVVTRQPIGQPLTGHTGSVYSVAFSPDGKTLASGSYDKTIILWDVAIHQPIGQPLTGHTDYIRSVAFSPDGKTLASGSGDNKLILWDIATRQPIGQPLTGHTSSVNSVAFSPDGKTLASGSGDKTIMLWDVATRQPIGQPLKGHTSNVYSVAFSPDGKTLASGSGDSTMILWDVATRQPIGQPLTGHSSNVISVAFSPDSKMLASGSDDKTIILWDTSTRQPISQPLTGHIGSVWSVAFSPNGKKLASAANLDKTIILWDLDVESWKSGACYIANINLTGAEWMQYIDSDLTTYRATCPGLPKSSQQADTSFYREADRLSLAHDQQKASQLFALAVQMAIQTYDANLNNSVCWLGSLDGYANVVMKNCERAVTLEPTNGSYRDSRGVARALLGDKKGAIEDFKAFVEQYKGGTDKHYILLAQEREQWITALEAGNNPFDATTLEALHDE